MGESQRASPVVRCGGTAADPERHVAWLITGFRASPHIPDPLIDLSTAPCRGRRDVKHRRASVRGEGRRRGRLRSASRPGSGQPPPAWPATRKWSSGQLRLGDQTVCRQRDDQRPDVAGPRRFRDRRAGVPLLNPQQRRITGLYRVRLRHPLTNRLCSPHPSAVASTPLGAATVSSSPTSCRPCTQRSALRRQSRILRHRQTRGKSTSAP